VAPEEGCANRRWIGYERVDIRLRHLRVRRPKIEVGHELGLGYDGQGAEVNNLCWQMLVQRPL
jgi:hypothetical protein